jgi:hypothetical protein
VLGDLDCFDPAFVVAIVLGVDGVHSGLVLDC